MAYGNKSSRMPAWPLMMAYGPLYWELSGECLVWGIAIFVLTSGVAFFRCDLLRDSDKSKGESYFSALSFTLLLANGLIAFLFSFGLVFLAIFPVVSGFWFFWEMFYLLGIPMVFHVFPVLTLVAWAWSVIGWRKLHYSSRALLLSGLLTVALTLSASSYFLFEFGIRAVTVDP